MAKANPYEIPAYDDSALLETLALVRDLAEQRWAYHEHPFRKRSNINGPYTSIRQHHPLTSALADVQQQMVNLLRQVNAGTYRDCTWHCEYDSPPFTLEQEQERMVQVRERVKAMIKKWEILIALFGEKNTPSLHEFVR